MALTRGLKRFIAAEFEKQFATHESPAFVVDKDRLTDAEREFVTRAQAVHQLAVHRPSWPDFLVSDEKRLFGVEVKSGTDWISENQRRTFDMLTNAGLMEIYVWERSTDKLRHWKNARAMRSDWQPTRPGGRKRSRVVK